MKVLVACEFSGIVRQAFITRGHNAISCDLLPSEQPGPHYQGNVFDIINEGFDLMVAHPPCTYLCNSGVRWLFGGKGQEIDNERWEKMEKAAAFFRWLLDAPIPKIAIENPIMHGYARRIIQTEPAQIIQPYEYGHGETKSTCLWLKGLSLLRPTHVDAPLFGVQAIKEREQRIHKMPPSADRWKERSKTFQGIADAMADQWSA